MSTLSCTSEEPLLCVARQDVGLQPSLTSYGTLIYSLAKTGETPWGGGFAFRAALVHEVSHIEHLFERMHRAGLEVHLVLSTAKGVGQLWRVSSLYIAAVVANIS
eukprot:1986756-Amphidinium_carterae.1